MRRVVCRGFPASRAVPRLWAPVRQDVPGRGPSFSHHSCRVPGRRWTRFPSLFVACQRSDQRCTSLRGFRSLATAGSRGGPYVGGKTRRGGCRAGMPVDRWNPVWCLDQETVVVFRRRAANFSLCACITAHPSLTFSKSSFGVESRSGERFLLHLTSSATITLEVLRCHSSGCWFYSRSSPQVCTRNG
jgi:hypothetical protein